MWIPPENGLMADSLQQLISHHLPPDWGNSPARKEQISRVVSKVLAAGPLAGSISDRRINAQEEVANERGVAAQTVVSKLGRETWANQYEGDEYFPEHLDPALI